MVCTDFLMISSLLITISDETLDPGEEALHPCVDAGSGVDASGPVAHHSNQDELAWHISLIVSSKVTIWRDDSEDLRFIVLHVELRSQQGALDVFLSLMTEATLKCKQFSCDLADEKVKN